MLRSAGQGSHDVTGNAVSHFLGRSGNSNQARSCQSFEVRGARHPVALEFEVREACEIRRDHQTNDNVILLQPGPKDMGNCNARRPHYST